MPSLIRSVLIGSAYTVFPETPSLSPAGALFVKYEGRGASLMPHNLIVPFCLACRVSVDWLLTGIEPARIDHTNRRLLELGAVPLATQLTKRAVAQLRL